MGSEEAVRILRQPEGSQPEARRFLAMALTTWAPSQRPGPPPGGAATTEEEAPSSPTANGGHHGFDLLRPGRN